MRLEGVNHSERDRYNLIDMPIQSSDISQRITQAPVADRLILIDGRTLERECFVRSVELSHPLVSVAGYGSVRSWLAAATEQEPPTAVLINIGARTVSDPAVAGDLARLIEDMRPTPVIVLAESEDLREMIAAIDRGARGYIPASVGFGVIVEAMRLTAAGGMFLPASSVTSLRDVVAPRDRTNSVLEDRFTARQSDVAKALRRGKANKIIAYELNMSESTVKVHIRHIMKKLGATNRTEAAFKLNALYASGDA